MYKEVAKLILYRDLENGQILLDMTWILEHLEKKEQIMLFINRRGYSSFVSCRSCGASYQAAAGYTGRCPYCGSYQNVGEI